MDSGDGDVGVHGTTRECTEHSRSVGGAGTEELCPEEGVSDRELSRKGNTQAEPHVPSMVRRLFLFSYVSRNLYAQMSTPTPRSLSGVPAPCLFACLF